MDASQIIDQALESGVDFTAFAKALCRKATELKTTQVLANAVRETFAEQGLTIGGKVKQKRRVYWSQSKTKKPRPSDSQIPLPSPTPQNETATQAYSTNVSGDEVAGVIEHGDLSDDFGGADPVEDDENSGEDGLIPTGMMSPAPSPPATPTRSNMDAITSPVPTKTPNRNGDKGEEIELPAEFDGDAWDNTTLVDRFWNNSKSLPTIVLTDSTATNWLNQNLDDASLTEHGFYASYVNDHQYEAAQTLGQNAAKMLNGERTMKNLAAILTYFSYIRVWEHVARKHSDKPVNSFEVRRARDAKLAKFQYFNFANERLFKNCANTGLRLVSFLEYICTYKDRELLSAAKRFINYIPNKMIYEDGSEQNWAAYVMEWTSYKIPDPKPYRTMKPQYHFDAASRA